MFPPSLDEYIAPDNPVRFIDAFVDQLDLQALGFQRVGAASEGRPAYHPADLLKLYLYGYLNRVGSSRCLERETHCKREVMWVLKNLTPDHKTIADFRKDNLKALKAVGCEFTLLCKGLGLLGGELVAIDGSKFKAVNNRKRNVNPQKLERALREMERKIEGYLKELDQADKEEPESKTPTAEELKEKIAQLRDRKQKYQGLEQELKQGGETQGSLTDPDSRSMPVGQATDVCYHVQTAVAAKHEWIVAPEVTNAVTAQGQLAQMALRAKTTLGVEQMEVVADMGYFDGDEVTLTPRSGDYGRDVIAVKRGLGFVRVIDQVKAYKPGHLVTADDVRALMGVLQGDGASKGFLSTTSDFAPKLQEDPLIVPFIPSRLELVDGRALLKRLEELAKKDSK